MSEKESSSDSVGGHMGGDMGGDMGDDLGGNMGGTPEVQRPDSPNLDGISGEAADITGHWLMNVKSSAGSS